MGKFKKLAGETAIYGLSSIVGKTINFLLVPFYTSTAILRVDEYGMVTELYSYVAVFNVLFLYGMETAYFRFTSKSENSESSIYDSIFSSILITSLVLSAILVLFATPIVNWLEFPGQERFIYWLAAILAVDAVIAIPFVRLRYEGKALRFASLKLVNISINLGLNLFFLYFCKNIWLGNFLPGMKGLISYVYNPDFNVEYVFLANLIANACYVPLMIDLLKKSRLKPNFSLLYPMLVYAFPLLLAQLAGNFNEMFSRMMLKKILPDGFYEGISNQEALGIFGACYKLSMIMALAIQAFRFAAEPFLFKESQSKDAKKTYADIFYYFALFGMLAVIAISLNLETIKRLVLQDELYWTGLHIVPLLLMGSLFLGLFYNLSIWFKIQDKTIYGTIITVLAAVVTIVLNLLLIPIYGYLGSAMTTLVVYLFMCVITYLVGQKYYPIHYDLKTLSAYLFLCTVLLIVGWNISTSSWIITQLLREIPILVFLALLFVGEKKKIRINKN